MAMGQDRGWGHLVAALLFAPRRILGLVIACVGGDGAISGEAVLEHWEKP